MNYILFDTKRNYQNLLPLTFTRPISELRIGILKIKEKWEKYLYSPTSNLTQAYLKKKYPIEIKSDNFLINSSVLPNVEITKAINSLNQNTYLFSGNNIIAVRLNKSDTENFKSINFVNLTAVPYTGEIRILEYLHDIFSLNEAEIAKDFKLLTENRNSAAISDTNTVFNEANIFIERGAIVECSVLNATEGYIYIGKDATVMENSVIRGSFALCEHSQLKVGSIIYGATTIGPHSKVGGEVSNSVILGYSNKAHAGFLGNSVIGEWCNLGADTNNSNLKNNYDEVKLWNYREKKFIKTGLLFCGLIMGDYSKCGINTMFNTGTVIGISTNIYGSGFPRNFVPSFAWGGVAGFVEYKLNKVYETAQRTYKRRNIPFTTADKEIIKHIFDITKENRNFKN